MELFPPTPLGAWQDTKATRVRPIYDEAASDEDTRVLVDRLWPRGLADPPAQAVDRPGQQRRLLRIALDERQPGEGGQAEGHAAGAVRRQAELQPLVHRLPGFLRPALSHGRGAEVHPGDGGEPGIVEGSGRP